MIKKIIKLLMIVCLAVIVYIGGFYLYHLSLAVSSSPQMVGQIEDTHRKLPSNILIRKLHTRNFDPFFDPYYILKVLAERKEKGAVPEIIGLLKSTRSYYRHEAIRTLARINDSRSIEPLMEIIKKGKSNADYDVALMALSEMKYDGAFPYVLELAKENDAYRNGSVAMLKEFGRPEYIPILVDIKNRIKDTDPMPTLGRSLIDDAIKHIESLQKNIQRKIYKEDALYNHR